MSSERCSGGGRDGEAGVILARMVGVVTVMVAMTWREWWD